MNSHRQFKCTIISSNKVPVGRLRIQFEAFAGRETIDSVPQTAFDPESLPGQVLTEITQYLDKHFLGLPIYPPDEATVYVHMSGAL